jgi:hypothetical protein
MLQQQLNEKKIFNSLILVIRSSNERTYDVCKELCLKNSLIGNISIIQECPFESALRKCYETGITSNKKWMVTIDADVLLYKKSIECLVHNAELMPPEYIQLEGRVFDKITGMYRQAGHRIYRVKYLPLALSQIPSNGTQIRPEYYTLQQMGRLGHPSRRIPDVLGIHDFEQNYFDIYRKSFIHARKHPYWIKDMIERCADHLHEDPDFLVILKGLWDGLTTKDSLSIDRRKFSCMWNEAGKTLLLDEKPPINDVDEFIQNLPAFFERIKSQNPSPVFVAMDEPSAGKTKGNGWPPGVKRRISKHGAVKGSISVLGGLLTRIGKILDN